VKGGGRNVTTVDVLMPYYGDVSMMQDAVRSVIAQSDPNWRLTVVDDGNADGVPEWFAGLGDDRVRYLRNERNLGVTGNFNRCLDLVDAVCEITGSDKLNLIGMCAGGIFSTLMLCVMAARGDKRVRAATFGVTLMDFASEARLQFEQPLYGVTDEPHGGCQVLSPLNDRILSRRIEYRGLCLPLHSCHCGHHCEALIGQLQDTLHRCVVGHELRGVGERDDRRKYPPENPNENRQPDPRRRPQT